MVLCMAGGQRIAAHHGYGWQRGMAEKLLMQNVKNMVVHMVGLAAPGCGMKTWRGMKQNRRGQTDAMVVACGMACLLLFSFLLLSPYSQSLLTLPSSTPSTHY